MTSSGLISAGRALLGAVAVAVLAFVGLHWPDRGGSGNAAGETVLDALGRPVPIPPEGLTDAGAAFGLLLVGSWLAGRACTAIGVPKITGFLLFGLVCGPSALGLVTKESLPSLTLVNNLAIALIALTAGGEIQLSFLRRSMKVILSIAGVQVAAIAAGVWGVMFLVLPAIVELPRGDTAAVAVVALIVGVLAVANSPAVVIAMIAELNARGLMAQTALAVTICKDLALVVLFAVVMAVAGTIFASGGDGGGGGGGGAHLPLYLTQHLGGSVVAGVAAGVVFGLYLRLVRAHLPIFVVFAGFGMALLSDLLGLETLIVALIAGMLMRNVESERSRGLFETVEDLSLPVYCVFFALAGAKVDLNVLAEIWHWALLLVGARLVMVVAGTWVGARIAGIEPPSRGWLWTAFAPQAGVAVALATIVSQTFGDEPWSLGVFNLLLALIAVNELVGPLLFKLGLVRSGSLPGPGEAPARAA